MPNRSILEIVGVSTALLAVACAPGTNWRPPVDVAPLSSEFAVEVAEVPAECLRSDMALDGARSLDTWFDSAQAAQSLAESWPPLVGSVFVTVVADAESEDGSWGVVSDVPDSDAVRSIVDSFRASQRNVPLPDRDLRVYLGDENGVEPRLLGRFGGCPAEVLGPEGVEARLLETAETLSGLAGVDHVLAVDVDELGRPTRLIYTGRWMAPAVQSVVATAILASARFRPAYVEGIPVRSRISLANAEVYVDEIQEVAIAGLDGPLRDLQRRGRGNPITSASRSGANGGIPCGTGGSQYARMCGYDFATGRVTNSYWNSNLRHLERLERSSERGSVSFKIDQRLQRNR